MNPLIGATSGPSLRGPGPLIALCLIVIGLWVSAGPIGLGVSIGVILTWLALGTPYAVAVGFIGLAASAPTETGTMIETATGSRFRDTRYCSPATAAQPHRVGTASSHLRVSRAWLHSLVSSTHSGRPVCGSLD